MDLKIIVRTFLELNKYDGLVDEGGECGCDITEEDFMACGEPHLGCEPGYKVSCSKDCDYNGCGEHYHIVNTEPKTLEEVER